MKNRFLVLSQIILVVSALVSCSSGEETGNSFVSPDKRIEISSIEGLENLRNSKAQFKLTADLDFSGIDTWRPIDGFSGTLDGEGHSITNFDFSFSAFNNGGLFGILEGSVNNLSISGNLVGRGGCENIGMLCGTNKGTISTIIVEGSVTAEYSTNVGGVAGYSGEKISSCKNSASVTGLTNVGGIAGYLLLGHNQSLDGGSDNKADVSGKNNVGGIFGHVHGDSYYYHGYDKEVFIKDSSNSGAVHATADCVGGIAGYVSSGENGDEISVSFCTNSGKIAGATYVGGIVGGGSKKLYYVNYCENKADVSGTGSYVGGYIGGSDGGYVVGATNGNAIKGFSFVGSIVGKAKSAEDCTNKGSVEAIGQDTIDNTSVVRFGGIAGSVQSITKCINNGLLKVSTYGGRIGGVAGEINISYPKNQIISGNINTADIVSQGGDVGGIIGYVSAVDPFSADDYSVEIKLNENSGTITSNSNNVGGIVGRISSSLIYYRYGALVSFNTNSNVANITGHHNVGGLVGSANHVNDNNDVWMTNEQTGTITATSEDGTAGNYYGIIK